jgi:hypothetical protein
MMALTSRDSHHPRKTGSSPIRNIQRRSPRSLFNAGSGASAHTAIQAAESSTLFHKFVIVKIAALQKQPIFVATSQHSATSNPLQQLEVHKSLPGFSNTSNSRGMDWETIIPRNIISICPIMTPIEKPRKPKNLKYKHIQTRTRSPTSGKRGFHPPL